MLKELVNVNLSDLRHIYSMSCSRCSQIDCNTDNNKFTSPLIKIIDEFCDDELKHIEEIFDNVKDSRVVNKEDYEGKTVIMHAFEYIYYDKLCDIIMKFDNLDFTIKDNLGNSTIHYFIDTKNFSVIKKCWNYVNPDNKLSELELKKSIFFTNINIKYD